ncbi:MULTISPECIES: site-specific DNA-methyltransferase [unclassified Streptococcus]|uniref:site-specific DNA-methyltransferase n=1 Tax=unclassified Streptococcus TaxID=2608887 RepID=UPI001072AA16|nr:MULTISPECIES: site-specific DNA-methyltransferase [unclassified Streptococcus]MBF0805773.1 site-specific DNA-methyltransferase [Streptococcus sp. 19428wA2_WM07]TFU28682.1 site-specific DNA-methyltransferase [Streptococcus sp. WM07]
MAEAGKPTTKTLRPDLEESVDFEKSENVFITGDNLEVLKILQESYLDKIDMIYIDPPYNTGKDFVYSDKFQKSEEELLEDMDLLDDQGQKKIGLTKNEKSSARYHSDWLNMMYPRLVLARNLLKESGIIFISIDDNEQANLKSICDEIFGEENFCGQYVWKRTDTPANLSKTVRQSTEFIFSYKKGYIDRFYGVQKYSSSNNGLMNQSNSVHKLEFPENIVDTNLPDGIYEAGRYGTESYDINLLEKTEVRNKVFIKPVILEGKFKWGQEYLNAELKKGTKISIKTKAFSPSYEKEEYDREVPPSLIDRSVGVTVNEIAQKYLDSLFDRSGLFTNPKPVDLIEYLVEFQNNKNLLILDFFAGSATTADAVMQLNAEDGGNRKYILCTLDEEVAEKSAAKEAGYQTIDQISRERIRRAAQEIQEEHPETIGKQDYGFRAYRLDSSNFKDVGQKPGVFTQKNLFDSVSNIKEARSGFDLLFQIMLTWGMELSLPVVQSEIDGIRVFDVAEGSLFACFADDMTESVIRKIAKERPLRAVFKDESFANSAGKINLMQIFKEESPETKVKVV